MSLGSLAETYGFPGIPHDFSETRSKNNVPLGNGVFFGQLTILIWGLGSLSYFQLGCEEVFFQHLPRLLHCVSHPTAFGGLWGANLNLSAGPLNRNPAVNGSQYLGKFIRQWYRHTCTIMHILYIPRLFVIGLIQHHLGGSINRDTVIPQNGWFIVYSGKA